MGSRCLSVTPIFGEEWCTELFCAATASCPPWPAFSAAWQGPVPGDSRNVDSGVNKDKKCKRGLSKRLYNRYMDSFVEVPRTYQERWRGG